MTKRNLQEIWVTESQFENNVAFYTEKRKDMEQVASVFVKTVAEWRLTVFSLEKITPHGRKAFDTPSIEARRRPYGHS